MSERHAGSFRLHLSFSMYKASGIRRHGLIRIPPRRVAGHSCSAVWAHGDLPIQLRPLVQNPGTNNIRVGRAVLDGTWNLADNSIA